MKGMIAPTAADPAVAEALRRFTGEIARREAGRFVRAVLFGSHARHQARQDSDVDVAVVLSGPEGDLVRTKLAMADVAYDVMLDTGVLIQPLPVWQEAWEHPERHRNPRLIENIRREGVGL